MTAPTLGEVLELIDSRPALGPLLQGTVYRCFEFILANREWLERAAREQAARKALGRDHDTPVRVLPTDDPPELVTIHYEGSDCRMIEVGANWKPEGAR